MWVSQSTVAPTSPCRVEAFPDDFAARAHHDGDGDGLGAYTANETVFVLFLYGPRARAEAC